MSISWGIVQEDVRGSGCLSYIMDGIVETSKKRIMTEHISRSEKAHVEFNSEIQPIRATIV